MNSIATLPDQQVPTTLSVLAEQINQEHRLCVATGNIALDHAHVAGDKLVEAKAIVGHGHFAQWLHEHFEGSDRTARAYMRISQRWPEIEAKRQRVANLSYRQALLVLAPPNGRSLKALTDRYARLCRDPINAPRDEVAISAAALKAALDDKLVELRDRLDHAESIQEMVAVEREAKQVCNCASSMFLDSRRAAGKLLSAIGGADRLSAGIVDDDVDQDYAATLPELSADVVVCGFDPDDRSYMVEIHPDVQHPGYYHLAVYQDIDTDNSDVVYDRRAVRYDRKILAYVLTEIHHIRPVEWASEPARSTEPWFLRAAGTPAKWRDARQ